MDDERRFGSTADGLILIAGVKARTGSRPTHRPGHHPWHTLECFL